MMGECSQENGLYPDGIGHLFFQQVKFNGVRPATAIFVVAGTVMTGATLFGLRVIIAASVFLFMYSCVMAYLDKGRMRSHHILTMANGIEVGRKYGQQEQRFDLYGEKIRHYLQ